MTFRVCVYLEELIGLWLMGFYLSSYVGPEVSGGDP